MKMSRKQRACLPFLLTAAPLEKVARKCGVAVATLRRWLADDVNGFASALDGLLEETIQDAAQEIGIALAAVCPDAIATIKSVLKDPKADRETQLRAALAAIDRLLRIAEFKSELKTGEPLEER